jgi:hypothetical protein
MDGRRGARVRAVQGADGAINRGMGSPGERARGTDAESEFHPTSTPARSQAWRRARKTQTRGPRVSETAGGSARGAGPAGPLSKTGSRNALGSVGCVALRKREVGCGPG